MVALALALGLALAPALAQLVAEVLQPTRVYTMPNYIVCHLFSCTSFKSAIVVGSVSIQRSQNPQPKSWEDLASAGAVQEAWSTPHTLSHPPPSLTELPHVEGQAQVEDFHVSADYPARPRFLYPHRLSPSHLQIQPVIVRHLRIVIKSGHEPFCAIYSIKAEGTPIDG